MKTDLFRSPLSRAAELRDAECLARIPMRMGGLGSRSAVRCARAAYWAWADAIQMLGERTPSVANMVVQTTDVQPAIWVSFTQQPLGWTEGFWWRPSWSAPREEQRPPEINAKEPGEWPHGWQCWTSSITDSHFRTAARRAHLRSHSGWNAGAALAFAPTALEFSIQPHLFRVFFLLERLQLPLPVTEAVCKGCHAPLDAHGRHRAGCPRSARLKTRATPMERVLARVPRSRRTREMQPVLTGHESAFVQRTRGATRSWLRTSPLSLGPSWLSTSRSETH